jgi:hypothetical protein
VTNAFGRLAARATIGCDGRFVHACLHVHQARHLACWIVQLCYHAPLINVLHRAALRCHAIFTTQSYANIAMTS